MLLLVCVWLCALSSVFSFENKPHIDVETSLGTIRGTILKSRLGIDFYAFRGIKYAEAPRFQNPVPVAAWKPTILDATRDGPMCPQVTRNVTDMAEDCLRLNIYTKNIKGDQLKPVIFYMHPGGFYFSSGQSHNYVGPQHLMDRDVVLVTINYRLGSLGFLSTGDANAPGNAGLKDQVEALRWVKSHIATFGGNPDSVTLFGYSAGSLSIGLHMLSPMSKGLFHRAIAMSASPFAQWKYAKSDLYLAEKQAKLLNCTVETTKKLVDCLKTKSALDFANSLPDMFEFSWNPVLNWYPVIEEDFGQERFLIENPYKTVLTGDIYKVPLITGITEFEFLSSAYYNLVNETHRSWFNDHFEKYAPIAFMYDRNRHKSEINHVTQALRSFYLQNKTLAFPESFEKFGQLYSDAVIGFEYDRFLKLMAQVTPVYNYMFKYKGRYSHFYYPANQTYGAVHHDELLYLFHVAVRTPLFKSTDPENTIIERLTRMWAEFALKSDPNNVNDEYLKDMHWSVYNEHDKNYLEIGDALEEKHGGVYQKRYKVWDELFPISNY